MVEPLICIEHHGLWSLKAAFGFQFPVKPIRVDAKENPGGFMSIHFHLCQKVSAVDKAKAYGLSLKFISGFSL